MLSRLASRLLVLALCLALLPDAMSQRREKVEGISKKVYEAIAGAQELIDQDNYSHALAMLQDQRDKRMTAYETAQVLNMIGYTWYQLDDLDKAKATYIEALSQERLPETQQRALLTTLAQLSLVSEEYVQAEDYTRRMLDIEVLTGHTPPSDFILLAQSLYGQERYQDVIEPIQTALKMQQELGQPPRENWLALLSSAYFGINDYETMRKVVIELVELYPKEQYLMNLAALHGQLGETEKQMVLIQSLLDDQRLERGHYLLNLANLFLAHELPFKAATLLEQEIGTGRIEDSERNLKLLSQAWYLAGEEAKAIPPLIDAAEASEDGKLYLRVARLYMDVYDWENADHYARAAIDKGGLDEVGDAQLLRGMALVRMDQYSAARRQFLKAADSEKNAKWAAQWLKFVESEERRVAALQ